MTLAILLDIIFALVSLVGALWALAADELTMTCIFALLAIVALIIALTHAIHRSRMIGG